VAFGYSIIALNNIKTGLDKVVPNKQVITKDLHKHVVILSEAYQPILRKNGIENAYDKIKEFTRVNASSEITIKEMHSFIANLDIDMNIKKGNV
jgi:adenylosuccinate lyase